MRTGEGSPLGSVAVEIAGLTKRYGDRLALDQVDLSVAAGRTTAVLGPNGSGKTTLVEILVGLRDSGRVIKWSKPSDWCPVDARRSSR